MAGTERACIIHRRNIISFEIILRKILSDMFKNLKIITNHCKIWFQISLVSALYMVTMMVFFSHFYVNEYIFKKKEKKGLDKKAE